MSEVLLVSPSPLVRRDSESTNSSRSFYSSAMNSSCGSLAQTVLDDLKPQSLSMPIEVEEQHCRETLLFECKFERLNLAQRYIAIREQMECKRLRLREAKVAMQEALLHHRMERFAYLEQRYARPPQAHGASDSLNSSIASDKRTAPPKSIPKSTVRRGMKSKDATTPSLPVRVNTSTPVFCALVQEEMFARELLSLEATHAWVALWSELPPPPKDVSRVDKTCAAKAFAFASDASSAQMEEMRSGAAAVCDEAETLSFALDNVYKDGERVMGPGDFPAYPVDVMRAAAALIDELRRRLYSGDKRRKAAARVLHGAKQRAEEQSERARLLQRTVDATEESAAAVATAFQLRLPAVSVSQSAGETYAERVLHEVPNAFAVLQRQLQWQEERAAREVRDRESALEMIFVQTSRLAALLRQMLGPSAPVMLATGGEVSIANVAGVLESIIASVVALRDDGNCGFLESSTTNYESEEAMRRTIGQMQRRIDGLLAERKKWGKTGGNPNDEDGDAQVLLMVMRRLQEVRGEKLALELAHESRRERRPVHCPPPENRENKNGAEEQKDTQDWVQTIHKLTEDNALLREEVRLEQESRQALAAQLKVAERFVRDLQKQCRRLRQSGRIGTDAYEVVQGDKCDRTDSDESNESSDSDEGADDDALEKDLLQHEGGEKGANRDTGVPRKPYFIHKAPPNIDANDEIADSANDSASLNSDSSASSSARSVCPAPPLFSREQRAAYRACLRDHRRFATALRVAHGLSVCTFPRATAAALSLSLSLSSPNVSGAFAGCAISLHAMPRAGAAGPRRLAVLYPLPNALRAQRPLAECARRVRRAARHATNTSAASAEVIDLRAEFAHAGKFLRGCMDVCVAPSGRFVYALASADEDVLARLCAPTALGIPPERRFRFAAANAETGVDEIGWCGRGACAWAVEAMRFESPAEQQRFERHMQADYELALRLSAEEARRGAGGCVELLGRTRVGKTVRKLFMSVGAYEGISVEHRAQLTQFYGPNGIATIGIHNIERETAAPLRRFVAVAQWHGDQSLAKPFPKDLLKTFGLELDKS